MSDQGYPNQSDPHESETGIHRFGAAPSPETEYPMPTPPSYTQTPEQQTTWNQYQGAPTDPTSTATPPAQRSGQPRYYANVILGVLLVVTCFLPWVSGTDGSGASYSGDGFSNMPFGGGILLVILAALFLLASAAVAFGPRIWPGNNRNVHLGMIGSALISVLILLDLIILWAEIHALSGAATGMFNAILSQYGDGTTTGVQLSTGIGIYIGFIAALAAAILSLINLIQDMRTSNPYFLRTATLNQ